MLETLPQNNKKKFKFNNKELAPIGRDGHSSTKPGEYNKIPQSPLIAVNRKKTPEEEKIESESGEIMRILIENPELIVEVQRVIEEKLKGSLQ